MTDESDEVRPGIPEDAYSALMLCTDRKSLDEWKKDLAGIYLRDVSYVTLDHMALGNLLWHMGVAL